MSLMPKPDALSLHQRKVLCRAGTPELGRWLTHTASTRGCVRPVRLTGYIHTVDSTSGEVLDTRHTTGMPNGVLYVPCGDRRASVCPPCAETYRADTYHLIKAGLVGGKGVPTSVGGHPVVFATFTAPSFGPVHTRAVNSRNGKVQPCHMRRNPTRCPHGKLLICTARHTENHPSLGRPLCLDCYDHAHHVVWNGWAGELWRRTTITLNRALRQLEHLHGVKLRLSFAKVAEYQRRGIVHFHALIRLDGRDPDNPDVVLMPPPDITSHDLAVLVADAATTTAFHTPTYADTEHTWSIHWGQQLDIRPISDLGTGHITSEAVAAYLAKYATKATETTGLPTTGRMSTEAAEHYSDAHTHIGRLVAYAFQLGTRPHDWTTEEQQAEWHDTWGRLRRWTHMLGFGGHFATKSRRYSTTHKALRAQRRTWHRQQHIDWRRRIYPERLDESEDDTTLVICQLTLAGIGWNTTGDAQLAADAAARAREYRRLVKEERMTV